MKCKDHLKTACFSPFSPSFSLKTLHPTCPQAPAIALEFQKLPQTPTSETWMAQKLGEAENIGLIKKILVNKDDTPALVWNSQVPEKTSRFNRLLSVVNKIFASFDETQNVDG